ncbi:rhomboid family intramembrane serine protease [uncultured Polaribacter sp.]|uniref:rhomboid family intramembrane serine protease n=1 Tax=uncultured Polaribacter sp. TaxID=174711 RepID=UPI00262CEDEC|nr:rhomboid family intramembrane serine protease [uncultured Polaribacter sp.]
MSFIDNLKYKYKSGNIIEKLIYINIGVFLFTLILKVFSGLYKSKQNFVFEWFSLDNNLNIFISRPWSIISYGFLHADFIHLLFNMITLYFIGNLFVEYFTQKQALSFYILGTLFGGLFFILSQNYFPLFDGDSSRLVGASAGVSAIFIGIVTYMPNYQIKIPLLGFLKLWHLAVIWLAFDFIGLIGNNAGGSFSHLGGSLLGFLYVRQASNRQINFSEMFSSIFQKKEKKLKTVYNSNKTKNTKSKPNNLNQKQIDQILDKISKSGYDTLTKQEKEFLFKQGKK